MIAASYILIVLTMTVFFNFRGENMMENNTTIKYIDEKRGMIPR